MKIYCEDIFRKFKWHIGIDEAGRGPLAGPVAVGVVLVPVDFDWSQLPGVGDSKQVSEKNREEIYKLAKQLEKTGALRTVVVMGSAKQIDKQGIAAVIRQLVAKGLRRISENNDVTHLSKRVPGRKLNKSSFENLTPIPPFKWRYGGEVDTVFDYGTVVVKLDGGLQAPAEWVHQETIIKGDVKEKVIGLASIMAKVTRDQYMRRRAKLAAYTPYDFARHKGYGTKAHREAIAQYGVSSEHRQSFCKNIINVV